MSKNIDKHDAQWFVSNCPARCAKTGKCYGTAYFEFKTGKPKRCVLYDNTKTCSFGLINDNIN